MARAAVRTLKDEAPLVVPFALFLGFLALQPLVPAPQWLRFGVELSLFCTLSRKALAGAPSRPLASALLGIAVFAVWVAPDLLFPSYRHLPPFDNAIVGHAFSSLTAAQKHDWHFLLPRIAVSVIAVPVLEELFWRGFLLRFAPFGVVALLFASEHGPYWDVGLIAGILYNWWMLRTRNLWDCILAHSVTNACLAAFVVGGGHWQYWL